MDFVHKPRRENPLTNASFLSKVCFAWLMPLFWEGYKNNLDYHHLYDTLPRDLSSKLGDDLERTWKRQLHLNKTKNKEPSLGAALWSIIKWDYILMLSGVAVIELVFRIAQPLVLRELLLTFNNGENPYTKYIYAGAMTLLSLGMTIIFHPTAQFANMLCMRARIACSAIIYRKSLRLSKAGEEKTTIGQITNILSNDVSRFDMNMMHSVWIPLGIIQMASLTYFLWHEFGTACLPGVCIVILLMPVQYWSGKYSANCRLQIAHRTDERSKILNETIIGMKTIKTYAWEKPFADIIQRLRELEVKAIKKRLHFRGFYLSVYISIHKVVVFVTVMTYVLQGNSPRPDKVFFMVSCFFTMIQSMIYMVPSAISGLGELLISCKRMENFLLLEEKYLQPTGMADDLVQLKGKSDTSIGVTLKSVTAKWTKGNISLSDISLDLKGDKIVMVVGPVGSGKTSLLHVLLSELPALSGKCSVIGKVSYASQECWIFAGSIRQNILFGRQFNEPKYNQVIKAAVLEDDLKQLEFGDKTVVGERGISLSGGQKARINLARCLYQDADIYLLDDPLSAVDTRVSQQLFQNCIKEYLTGKLRILVTHQLQYLPHADHIVVLKEGRVECQGSFAELTQAGIDFVQIMIEDEQSVSRKTSLISAKPPRSTKIHINQARLHKQKQQRMEQKASGSIGFGIFLEYLKSAESTILLAFVVVACAFCQVSLNASDYWLSYWTSAETNQLVDKDSNYIGRYNYMYVFGGMVSTVILLNLLRAASFFTYCTRISINVHNRMLTSMIRAPAKFFDDNPSGRVMNRFTKDLTSMDELLPPTFFDVVTIFSSLMGSVAVIMITNYYAILPAVVLLIILIFLRKCYVRTAREIKRMESITKSPVFSHTAASFQGLTTIRSFDAEKVLIQQFDSLQDIHTSAWFMVISTNRCFGFWVEVLCGLFLAAVAFGILILQDSKTNRRIENFPSFTKFIPIPLFTIAQKSKYHITVVSGSFLHIILLFPLTLLLFIVKVRSSAALGLVITSAMSVTSWLQFGMRQSAEVENLMTSVERNLEYANTPAEAPLESMLGQQPPPNWPQHGSIKFQNVFLAYEDQTVLRDLTFVVGSTEKIGIVGRTGAGKSSIVHALFRLTQASGLIFIDDVLITKIGLHDLRKNISIIPQDPVLFSGSIRYNLDPFSEYTDEDIWNALERVELKNAVPALDFKVSDGGRNFSLGQRQLVCVARAILRRNKIIVIDEATANVDPQTDRLIQETIRSQFSNCTILTVAHRLHSVIDCDKILVLERGKLLEFDHPHVLLQKPDGEFSSMVRHLGKSSEVLLRKISYETFTKRRPSFGHVNRPEVHVANVQ